MNILESILSKIMPTAGAEPTVGRPSPLLPAEEPRPVDVDAVLSAMEKKSSQKLDWRHSIVDLLKMLEIDSGLAARKQLAQELKYDGALDGSARMNLWLHQQVMKKLEENGGQIPVSMKH